MEVRTEAANISEVLGELDRELDSALLQISAAS